MRIACWERSVLHSRLNIQFWLAHVSFPSLSSVVNERFSKPAVSVGHFIHFLLKHHYERMTVMIRWLDWVSGFLICITGAQLRVQKMKRCIRAHDCTHTRTHVRTHAHTPLTGGKKGGNNWSSFFKTLANHYLKELITICCLSASKNVAIYQSFLSSGRGYSLVISQTIVSGLQRSDWFYKAATGGLSVGIISYV